MKIAITGSTGLIGSYLREYFHKSGHQVSVISDHKEWFGKDSHISWDLKNNYIDVAALEGHDVIIHLAGANISAQSWSDSYKKKILGSRINSTKLLLKTIQKMDRRPKIFFCASAVGFYGNCDPREIVNENSSVGYGFLSQVCHEWENACADLVLYGVRLVHLRFGMVLSKKGGALTKMLPPFYFCLGGKLGSGRQKMSWIALNEIPRIIDFIITNDDISGPVNVVTPNPVTNWQFTKILGSVIHRPTILPVPAAVVRFLFGQMGQSLLLDGAHVVPEALIKQGYKFAYPDLKEALQKVIKT